MGSKYVGRFNVGLFDRVVDHFKKYPGNLAMGVPLEKVGPSGAKYEENGHDRGFKTHCGTVGCFGGWTEVFLEKKTRQTLKAAARKLLGNTIGGSRGWGYVEPVARVALGFTSAEADSLFHTTTWEEPFKSKYIYAKDHRTQVRVALAYFKHFRKKMLAKVETEANLYPPSVNLGVPSGRIESTQSNHC